MKRTLAISLIAAASSVAITTAVYTDSPAVTPAIPAATAETAESGATSSLPFEAPKMAPMPAATDMLTTIAFGSCLDEEKAMPIWDQILSNSPDLFLFTGDNVYADINKGEWVNTPDPAAFDFAYGTLAKNKTFQNFISKTPFMVTFDDHDYGKNDAGREYPLKALAKDKMLDFFSVPHGADVRGREGAYSAKIFGPEGKRIQIIMLDARTFRSPLTKTDDRNAPGKERYLPSQDPNQDMLGDAQWQWLEQELKKPAEVRLLVSSIQLIADTHGWEAWRAMPIERERMYSLINRVESGSVFVISGDRHVAGLYRKNDGLNRPLYEVTASSLNLSFNPSTAITKEWDKNHQIGKLYGPANFGLVTINWDRQLISFEIRDDKNATVRQLTTQIE